MRPFLLLVTALVLAVAIVFGSTLADTAPGPVAIIDGDTLQIGDRIVHLAGIDAPELGQRCMIENKDWRCGL